MADPRFDEAQAYAAGLRAVEEHKGLISHPVLMKVLAGWAIEIQRHLDRGHAVVLSANGYELARIEPPSRGETR